MKKLLKEKLKKNKIFVKLIFVINALKRKYIQFYDKNKKYKYVYPDFTTEIKDKITSFKFKPTISIIMPVYNVEIKWLDLAIKSVFNQWYDKWELCIVDDHSSKPEIRDYLANLKNSKIKIKFLDKNYGIASASNHALELCSGEYVGFLDHDDELTPDALFEIVNVINTYNPDFIYSDEDKVSVSGVYHEPHFKPDYGPDTILSYNYICHFTVIKRDLVLSVNGFSSGVDGAQDYDLFLKVLEKTNKVYHIPKVLYHWRKVPGSTADSFNFKSYANDAGKIALERAIERRGIEGSVDFGKYPGTYKLNYKIYNDPLVSIIIPFKDKGEVLKKCIDSIIQKSTYKNFEIIGISNDSTEKETFNIMDYYQKKNKNIKFFEYNIPFNYSKINNYAVSLAMGEHIVLMNNDIEIITPDWIQELLMYSQRHNTGCVGAKLYYPNDTIQHGGVIVGINGVAGHAHKNYHKSHPGYFSRLVVVQNLSAVTAALLMVKKRLYIEIGGLDEENLKIAFNDVDFCLRLIEAGYYNVFNPYCEAYHHESLSRGYEDTPEKLERFTSEVNYFKKRHQKFLERGDPYYNINLTLQSEDFSLK